MDNLDKSIIRVKAKQLAEAHNHVVTRGFLLVRICQSKRTRELFRLWLVASDLDVLVQMLRGVTLESRKPQDVKAPKEQLANIEATRLELQRALRDAIDTTNDKPILLSAAQYLINDLGFSWPWLVVELVSVWKDFIDGYANAESREVIYEIKAKDPVPPSMEDFHFKDIPNESAKARFARWSKETKLFLKQKEADYKVERQHAGKPSSQENIEKYVDWFFRHKVEKESIESIAGRTPSKSDSGADARTIERRIADVQKWLDYGI